jgi:Zn-dependent peptidase ImmA (M78 family)
VSQATLRKYAGSTKNEDIQGVFRLDLNTIFVKKDLPHEELLHVLAHEIVHAMEHQTSGLGEEARVDTIASWLLKLAKVTKIEELLHD